MTDAIPAGAVTSNLINDITSPRWMDVTVATSWFRAPYFVRSSSETTREA
jgi:hypothetical protein